MTAAAPPPAAVLEAMEATGFEVTHVYGLTEVYGPAVVCAWQESGTPRHRGAGGHEGAPGRALPGAGRPDGGRPETLQPVPRDGATLGEVLHARQRGDEGLPEEPQGHREAFAGGWFHTGDLAVWHPDGYIELKDRSKDIIISGGENISSIEVEDALYRHPAVAGGAVVARPDDKWGETPCAFVELKPGAEAGEAELIAFCRERLAHFKVPRRWSSARCPRPPPARSRSSCCANRHRAPRCLLAWRSGDAASMTGPAVFGRAGECLGSTPEGDSPRQAPAELPLPVSARRRLCLGVRLGLGHMPGDLVLDPEFFAFKFNDAEIIGMRPVDFLVDCAFDGRVLGAQRRNTLIRCHSDLQ
jgi:hypothetical protein